MSSGVWGLHGLRIEARGPEQVIEALSRRFIDLSPPLTSGPRIRIEFETVKSSDSHRVARPPGQGRAFYDPKRGEATYFPSKDLYYLEYGSRARVSYHPAARKCRISIVQPETEQLWLATHPLLTLPLLEWFKRQGKYYIHAAGLARNRRSILLPGKSGSGKSTLTVALLRSGFDFLGDDLVLLEESPHLEALAFPEKIDATRETLDFFPELQSVGDEPKPSDWPKYELRANEFYSSRVAWRTRPAVIVFPEIASTASEAGESTLQPLSTDEAFRELSASVLLTEPKSTRAHISILGELARTVPAYRMVTGRNLERAVSMLEDLLA